MAAFMNTVLPRMARVRSTEQVVEMIGGDGPDSFPLRALASNDLTPPNV